MKLSIEYCTHWNYFPRASSLASEILDKYGDQVKELTLIPSGGGVFEIIKENEDEKTFSESWDDATIKLGIKEKYFSYPCIVI